MKKFIRIFLVIIAILMTCTMPGQAAGSHRGGGVGRGGAVGRSFNEGGRFYGGGRGWGPGWGAAWGLGLWGLGYPYYGNPYYYGYPYYPYYDGATSTNVYVVPTQQQAVPSQSTETNYWYYCRNPQGYYPYVQQCPNGWMKVVASPPAQ